jgi:integrase
VKATQRAGSLQVARKRASDIAGAVKGANKQLAKAGQATLPDTLTLHALRRTFASVLVALGNDPRYVMDQIGHSNPTVTLGIYAQVMRASEEDRQDLRLLVEGANTVCDGVAIPVSEPA